MRNHFPCYLPLFPLQRIQVISTSSNVKFHRQQSPLSGLSLTDVFHQYLNMLFDIFVINRCVICIRADVQIEKFPVEALKSFKLIYFLNFFSPW